MALSEVLSLDMEAELSDEQLDQLYSGLDALDQQAVEHMDGDQLKELLLRAQFVMRSKQAQVGSSASGITLSRSSTYICMFVLTRAVQAV